ncbi:transcriptional regulator, LacI family [Aquiflexum balticum DSM 16537]|uniref:Transcriptional regulator, LacI family n=1 Tax=Aquiflexum balticum DSM 16537 TaxID=758820 RepID=A0A1W2H9K9_9BACT|nr:LacI family DNA-binding transcriptional regulator [Aquiflexum balticum]SMD45573.1 transcriptional regulator, LacI family [Aquiflexum balticum DSM 16537]
MIREHVTLKDIAKKLNLSVSTVSRALSDLPIINEETKKKVLLAAKEMDYHPNLFAKFLKTKSSNTIGVVVPDLEMHFFSSCISGMQNTCLENGYNLIICQSNESLEQEKFNIKTLQDSRVDGILISLSRETNSFDHLEQLKDHQIPFVYFDRVHENGPYSQVVINDEESSFEATEYLIHKGYKKIAFLCGPKILSICKNRLMGYQNALRNHQMDFNTDWVLESDLSRASTEVCIDNYLRLNDRPDAILAINDIVAINCIRHLKKKGIKIPKEMAVMGFSNSPVSEVIEPNLTTVEQPSFDMGKLAALRLLEEIRNPNLMSQKIFTLNTKIIERDST